METIVIDEREAAMDAIVSDVQASAVRLVRFLFCDTAGIIRGKTTHVKHLKARMQSGIGLVKGTMAMNILDQMDNSTGLGPVGEIRIVPDPNTFLILPYGSQSAMMLCDLIELSHEPYVLCPRSILKRQIAEARKMGVTFEVAFEPEFMIGRWNDDGDWVPLDESLCFSSTGMNHGNEFINRFCHALEAQGLEVEQYYPELGHGQHELSISHAPAMAACDRHLIYRETLRGVAFDLGLVASLAPKPFADAPGNGAHMHVSAWDPTTHRNLLFAEAGELSLFGKQFVAGLLEHLPALVALTAPSVNSYRRLKPKSWSSAYTCWGYENREAAVRIPTTLWGSEEKSTNIELKCVDSSCNPYIALAAVIAAGLDGVRRELMPPPPVQQDPSTLTAAQMTKLGVKRLPSTLKAALRALKKDEVIAEGLGEEFVRTYLGVKELEADEFAKHGVEFELENHRMKF